jgi:putative FmdB family regulatory protein
MPYYDVKCAACQHEYETLTDNPPKAVKCPECGKRKASMVFKTPPAYHARYSPMHPRVHRGRGY